jgi:hypothetical protein
MLNQISQRAAAYAARLGAEADRIATEMELDAYDGVVGIALLAGVTARAQAKDGHVQDVAENVAHILVATAEELSNLQAPEA